LAGAPVILTTTLGTLNPNRPTTRADGTATSTLQVGPQAGTATVTAIVGSSEAATTSVTVRDAPAALTLIPASTTIPASGTDITWTASVTNSTGDPASGVLVTFNSIGTFENGVTAFTDANGIATKKITYSQEQLNGVDSFTVTATAGSASDTSTVDVVR
jgi:adhesin/invasin